MRRNLACSPAIDHIRPSHRQTPKVAVEHTITICAGEHANATVMESLLSLSFENISSKEPTKIRKGLRQIEGLLAQICLSHSSPASPSKRHASAIPPPPSSPKTLSSLNDDPAFSEFWRLQEGFEWNGACPHNFNGRETYYGYLNEPAVTSRLITTLTTLLSIPPSPTIDALIAHALTLLQGLLLLHPPSRSLFATPPAMTLLLDLLDPPSTQSAALLTLVAALLSNPKNIRTFEKVDGLATITSLFKSKKTEQKVRVQVLEFLYFYLMPESVEDSDAVGVGGGSGRSQNSQDSAVAALNTKDGSGKSKGKKGGSGKSNSSMIGEQDTHTTREKQKLLGRYLSNVEDLVQDLRESTPFGEVAC